MDFYLTQNGVQRGPFRVFQIKEMVDRGEASPADLGWHPGLVGWFPLREIDAIAPYLPGASPPTEDTSDPHPAAGPAEPELVAPASPRGLPAPPPTRPPSRESKWHLFGLRALPRFLARSFDAMLWFSLVCGLGSALGVLPPLAFGIPVVVSFWFIPLHSLAWVAVEAWLLSRFGTTPGKWLFNLHVRDHEGGLPSYMNALKRAFFIWVFAWGMGHSHWAMFGSLISLMLFLQHGRMVWDHLVGTQIVQPRVRSAAWVVYAVALGVFCAAKLLIGLSQPIPATAPAEIRAVIQLQRAAFEQQRAALRETYRQSRPTDPLRLD
ncbi:MAG: RDD family protein [Verrucomicrobiales bacterium]